MAQIPHTFQFAINKAVAVSIRTKESVFVRTKFTVSLKYISDLKKIVIFNLWKNILWINLKNQLSKFDKIIEQLNFQIKSGKTS